MSRNTILTRIELAANDTFLAEWSTDCFSDLTDRAVGVDCASSQPHVTQEERIRSRDG